MFGYCSWADLLQNLGKQKPTPFDAFVDPEVVAARRTRYISILVDFGVSRADAEEVVDEIGPTSAGRFSSDG